MRSSVLPELFEFPLLKPVNISLQNFPPDTHKYPAESVDIILQQAYIYENNEWSGIEPAKLAITGNPVITGRFPSHQTLVDKGYCMQTMTLKFKALLIISSIVLTVSLIGCNQRTCTTLQTCKICNSTRMIKTKYRMGFIPTITEEAIKYKSKDYSHGVHNWTDGISSAVVNPVRDGSIVLVHKNNTYGAFILDKQDVDPEEATYTWYYRTDGMGIFDKKSTAIKTGSGREAQINFGPFSVAWSANTKGSGWIYYARQDGDPKKPEDLYICVTDKKSLEGIDASANTWIYKSARFDN